MSDNNKENPYQAPKAETIDLAERLIAEQNMAGVIIGTLSGLVPACLLATFFFHIPFVAFTIPGIFGGVFARFIGRGIELKYQLACSTTVFICMLIIQATIIHSARWFLFSLVSSVIAGLLSKRSLKREESDALYKRLVLNKE